MGPLAVRLALEAVDQGLEMTLDEGLLLEANHFGLLAATEDMREGLTAFLEKRPPKFRGKGVSLATTITSEYFSLLIWGSRGTPALRHGKPRGAVRRGVLMTERRRGRPTAVGEALHS